MATKRLHVMFDASAGGSLRQALAEAGVREKVVAFDDDFSIGPINPAAQKLRAQWAKKVLDVPYWTQITAQTGKHLAASVRAGRHPVIWFSRRDARSYCGFLEWLWQVKDKELEHFAITMMRSLHGESSLRIRLT